MKVEELIAGARQLREQFRADPQRLQYHFMAPEAWLNDPNGSFYWKGRYHVLYQHNPLGGYWVQQIQWGHASSADLVHWVHHPIALAPTPGGPDHSGCWSGGGVVNDGVPTVIYYGQEALSRGSGGGICIATSRDDELLTWTKSSENPVINDQTFKEDFVPFRKLSSDRGPYDWPFYQDACAWKHGEFFYALGGSRDKDGGGDVARLLKSPDMVHWEYLGPFYASERRWTEPFEDCAVPNFFPLGDKHLLLFASHWRGAQYYIGRYEDERFFPERHGRMVWPGGCFLAPSTILDDKGRLLMFAWMAENRMTDVQRASGWAGALTIPRVLTLGEDGDLRIDPVPELEILRYNHRGRKNISLSGGSELVLEEVRGDCLELAVEMRAGSAGQFGVKARCSPGGEEETRIVCDSAAGTLSVDFGKSSLERDVLSYPEKETPGGMGRTGQEPYTGAPTAQVAPFALKPGEPLELRVFLDRSVLEVYANRRQCVTQRIYPTRSDSLGVSLFASDGDVEISSVEAWDMHGIR